MGSVTGLIVMRSTSSSIRRARAPMGQELVRVIRVRVRVRVRVGARVWVWVRVRGRGR